MCSNSRKLLAGCVFLWTASSAVRAAIIPTPRVGRLCVEAELIVEGEYLTADRVRIDRVLKPSRLLDRHADEIVVGRLGEHMRIPRQMPIWTPPGDAQRWLLPEGKEIRTYKVVLFLTYSARTKRWSSAWTTDQEDQCGSAGAFWYDDQTCYGYEQIMNPGPLILQAGNERESWRVPRDVETLRAEIEAGLEHLRQWQAARALRDPAEKAQRLARFLLPHTAPQGYKGAFRRELREELPKLGRHAVGPLIAVIEEARPDERLNETVLILYDMGRAARPAVATLCELLGSPGKTSRYYILSALREAGDPAAAVHVRPMLDAADAQVATQAAVTLGALGDRASFDAIASMLRANVARGDLSPVDDLFRALLALDPQKARKTVEDPAFAALRERLLPK